MGESEQQSSEVGGLFRSVCLRTLVHFYPEKNPHQTEQRFFQKREGIRLKHFLVKQKRNPGLQAKAR